MRTEVARLVINADGSYDLYTNLGLGATIQSMRAALDHLEALQPSTETGSAS